eukprot:762686-Hanusia_phi.AAC.2
MEGGQMITTPRSPCSPHRSTGVLRGLPPGVPTGQGYYRRGKERQGDLDLSSWPTALCGRYEGQSTTGQINRSNLGPLSGRRVGPGGPGPD